MTAVEDPERNALRGFFGKVGRIFTGRGSETPSTKLDRRSTILLQAARSQTQSMDERSLTAVEDPGIDVLRGSFGLTGSIIRARSAHRLSQSSREPRIRVKHHDTGAYDPTGLSWASDQTQAGNEIQGLPLIDPVSGMKQYQLYDNPVPTDDSDTSSIRSFVTNSTSPPNDSRLKRPTIKFDSQDLVHQYDRPGTGPRSSTFVNPPDSPSSTATQQEPQLPKLPPPLGLPTEGALLQLESLDQSYDFREEANAPSTFSPQFQQAQAGLLPRKDSRDMFVDSPSSNTFPSITDSWRSGAVWDDAVLDDEELERQKQLAETRARANTINQMDTIPPALARLRRMNEDVISGRNPLTPVLDRDDAMREWERRQAGKPSAALPYSQLEYLQQQAEAAVAASGFTNWASSSNRYPPPVWDNEELERQKQLAETRARANTINQMDTIFPALARLRRMNEDVISGRNPLTPVLDRDDAIREWERRQAGKPSAALPYSQLEYLQQQARDYAGAVGEGYLDDAEASQRLFRRQSGGRGDELHEDIEIQATLNSASDLQLKSEQGENTSGNSEQNPTTDLPESNENLPVGGGLDSVAGDITGIVLTESESIDQKVDFDIQEIWKFFFILTLVILMYFAGE